MIVYINLLPDNTQSLCKKSTSIRCSVMSYNNTVNLMKMLFPWHRKYDCDLEGRTKARQPESAYSRPTLYQTSKM